MEPIDIDDFDDQNEEKEVVPEEKYDSSKEDNDENKIQGEDEVQEETVTTIETTTNNDEVPTEITTNISTSYSIQEVVTGWGSTPENGTHHHHHQESEQQKQEREEEGDGTTTISTTTTSYDIAGGDEEEVVNERGEIVGKIFVGDLSWDTTAPNFRSYFEKFGELTDCDLKVDSYSGRSRGFGFVTFADSSIVDKIMTEKHDLDGRRVEISRARKKGMGGGGGGGRRSDRDGRPSIPPASMFSLFFL